MQINVVFYIARSTWRLKRPPSPIKTARAADVCDFKLRYRDLIVHTRNKKPNMSEQIPNTLDYIKSEYYTKVAIDREESI